MSSISSHAVNVTLPVNSVIKANAVIIYFSSYQYLSV